MAKKQTEIRCPSCGATITKDYFSNNYDCPNCHDDLSDEEDILAAFGLSEINDEPEDIFEQLLKGSRYGEKNKESTTVIEPDIDDEDDEDIYEAQGNASDNCNEENNTSIKSSTAINEDNTPEEEKTSTPNKMDAMSALKAALSGTLDVGEVKNEPQNSTFSQSKSKPVPSDIQNINGKIIDTETGEILSEDNTDESDTFISEEDFITDDLYSQETDVKLKNDNSLEDIVDNIENQDKNESSTKKEMIMSAADSIRARLSSINDDNGPRIIEMEKRENVPDDYNSNWDGYYNDTESTIPPEPDVVNLKTIRRVVGSIVGIIIVSIFLIYWA